MYHRFCLSLRDVEELLAERGIEVTYETIRRWCLRFGQSFAKSLRRRQGRPGDTWFMDEVFVKIGGELHYLWRAVDQDGDALDILVQKRRDKRAAKRFFRKLLKGLRYAPRKIVTDKLRSYGAARKELLPSVIHDQGKRMNNRAEVQIDAVRPTCLSAVRSTTSSGFVATASKQSIIESFGTERLPRGER